MILRLLLVTLPICTQSLNIDCQEVDDETIKCSTLDAYQKFSIKNDRFTSLILTNCLLDVKMISFDIDENPETLIYSSLLNTSSSQQFMQATNVTFDCDLRQIPFPLIKIFPRMAHLYIPKCQLKTLAWQSIYTDYLRSVNLSTCPIECSCDHIWMLPGTEFNKLRPAPLSISKCLPHCQHGHMTVANRIIHANPGDTIEIQADVQDGSVNTTINRSYFEWAFKQEKHNFDEEISENNLKIVISNVTESNLGIIGIRCWHCIDYLLTRVELRINVPIRVMFDENSPPDTHILLVDGYPIDNLTLSITKLGKNISETNCLSSSDAIFFNSLIVRSVKKSVFYQRTYHIFSKDTIESDHLSGHLIFNICTPQICRTLEKNLIHSDHFSTTESGIIVKFNESAEVKGTSLVLAFLFFILILAILFHFREIICRFVREKVISFRKRVIWAHDLQSRRASRETEETLLRLEERSSLSSSDYTNQIIPFIDIGNITIHEKIGKGAFGEVYCGSWEKLGDRSVAVKTIKQADADLEKEALVVSRLDHPNIVRLYGMTRDAGNLLLVFEMMNLGDLRTYLRARAPQASNYSQFPPALTEIELKRIIADIISGVCYMAAQQIVHRDLAARNCLVSGKSDLRSCTAAQRPPIIVKISDFGMSRRLYSDTDYYRMEHQSLLPVRWLPPESITDHKFSHMSDIWSLGVTMWEIFSYGQIPFSELSNNEVVSYAMAGMRPPKTKFCPDHMYELIMKCWEVDPEKRISADEILLDAAFQEIRPKSCGVKMMQNEEIRLRKIGDESSTPMINDVKNVIA